MENIIKIENFEKDLINLLKEIHKNSLNIKEFLTQQVEVGDKKLSIMKVSWSSLRYQKPLFNENLFDKLVIMDKESTVSLFLKALSNDLLKDNSALKLFNHVDDKERFYKKNRSFKTLLHCEKLGIPIWEVIKIKEKQEILLPLYVWNHESVRTDLKPNEKLLDIEGKINFFEKNKKKWFFIETKITTNEEFISRLCYRIATQQKNKNYIKKLGLKINNEYEYIFNDGRSIAIKDLLIKNGLLKVIPLNEPVKDSLEIINLVCSNIPMAKREQISTQKRFAKMWFKCLKETDFSYSDEWGNLANHTFKQPSKHYLPLIDIKDSLDVKFEPEYSSNKSQLALYKWLTLLHEKEIDFARKNPNGMSAFSQALIKITVEQSESKKYFNDNSFLIKIWSKLKHEKKHEIFSQYMSQWDKITKFIEPELIHQKNSFQSPNIISKIIDLFTDSDIVDKEINSKLLTFFEKYESIKEMDITVKKLVHQKYKFIIPEKNTSNEKKIKI